MIISRPVFRQFAVVIAVNLIVLCLGMDISWSSPVLVKLGDPAESPLSHPITQDESGWIVSIGYIVSILMIPFMGLLVERLGRKPCILVASLPKIIAGVITIYATEVWMLLLARAINLTMNTAVIIIITMYSTEIASKENRGSLGSIISVFSCCGSFIMLGIGPYISYLNLSILLAAVTICTCIPLFFIPDTPYSLYKKGIDNITQICFFSVPIFFIIDISAVFSIVWRGFLRYHIFKRKTNEAKNVLIYFRGSETLAEEELKEFSQIEPKKQFDNIEILKNKAYLKALIIVVIMGMGVHLCGFYFILPYLQTILELTNTSITSALCSFIIGLIQLLASLSSGVLSDKFGRKPIIISTLLGMAVGMVGIGVFFAVKQHGTIISGFLNYLPLISIGLISWCYSGGVGSVYLVLVTELMDDKIRAIGTSASMLAGTTAIFLMSRYGLAILSAFGNITSFIMFAVMCIVLSLFVYIFVPETKDMTFANIQKVLEGFKVDGERKECVTKL